MHSSVVSLLVHKFIYKHYLPIISLFIISLILSGSPGILWLEIWDFICPVLPLISFECDHVGSQTVESQRDIKAVNILPTSWLHGSIYQREYLSFPIVLSLHESSWAWARDNSEKKEKAIQFSLWALWGRFPNPPTWLDVFSSIASCVCWCPLTDLRFGWNQIRKDSCSQIAALLCLGFIDAFSKRDKMKDTCWNKKIISLFFILFLKMFCG